MKERPILFSGPMVRAMLEGRKTQTRRIIKPQPRETEEWLDVDPRCNFDWKSAYCGLDYIKSKCRYGQHGDRLWVKETWRETGAISNPYAYKADVEALNLIGEDGQIITCRYRWRPSIHMPKEAARIWLEIDEIRVERVQDITLGDIAAEGNPNLPKEKEEWIGNLPELQKEFNWFIDLWNKINSKRGYGWDQNPWVWVVKFHVLEVENNG